MGKIIGERQSAVPRTSRLTPDPELPRPPPAAGTGGKKSYLHSRWDSYPAGTTFAGAGLPPAGITGLYGAPGPLQEAGKRGSSVFVGVLIRP